MASSDPCDSDPPDTDLPELTVEQADALREEVDHALGLLGHPDARVEGDVAVTAKGHTMDLGTIARKVLAEDHPPEELIREHLGFALRALESPDGRPPGRVVARLMGTEAYDPTLAGFEWAPGLDFTLALELPDTVETISHSALVAWGVTGRDLEARARANLLDTLPQLGEPRQHRGITVFQTESVFTASHALHLPEVVAHAGHQGEVADGVLFAAPCGHQLAFHVIDPAQRRSWRDPLVTLVNMALRAHSREPDPLSLHTYLWHDGQVTCLTKLRGETLEIHPGAYLDSL